MSDELVTRVIDLPGGSLRIEQPADVAELPDSGGVEWAPIAPYWAVMWRSGVALARHVAGLDLHGMRVVEIGCGLGLPSLAAARGGAQVLATDAAPEALELLARNAASNDVEVETMAVDWSTPGELIQRAPFDLLLAADVLYEREAIDPLLGLIPRLAPKALLADPGRPGADDLLGRTGWRSASEIARDGVVRIHELAPAG